MKTVLFIPVLCGFINYAFTQDTTTNNNLPGTISIDVPDFAAAHIKSFYVEYTNHLKKCIQAIREKNEAKATALFKNPGEQLVARSRVIEKEVIANPAEKQKWMQFAVQAYPYIKELERSPYYQKLYGKK